MRMEEDCEISFKEPNHVNIVGLFFDLSSQLISTQLDSSPFSVHKTCVLNTKKNK